ncbi:MAG: hypothetical protein K2X39_02715 [Silvanigrellaceae bacterium]|nr:hypothetical protein [Silvanigrellaceae bacterium]
MKKLFYLVLTLAFAFKLYANLPSNSGQAIQYLKKSLGQEALSFLNDDPECYSFSRETSGFILRPNTLGQHNIFEIAYSIIGNVRLVTINFYNARPVVFQITSDNTARRIVGHTVQQHPATSVEGWSAASHSRQTAETPLRLSGIPNEEEDRIGSSSRVNGTTSGEYTSSTTDGPWYVISSYIGFNDGVNSTLGDVGPWAEIDFKDTITKE